MSNFPTDILDKGHFEVTNYQLNKSVLLGTSLELRFIENTNSKKGFIIKLDTVVAVSDWTRNKNISSHRIDSDGSSFGYDIALRLRNDEYKNYNLLYLFEDVKHTSPIFRGLAKSISILNYNN